MLSKRINQGEMVIGVGLLFLATTIMCTIISASNFHLYSKYVQVKLDSEIYTIVLQCHIDRIITRETTDKVLNPSWTLVESKFLISTAHPLNNSTSTFEESSVPISTYNTVVNNSYPCYADPLDQRRQPLKSLPDVPGVRHEFVWRTCIPALIASPGLVIIILTIIMLSIDKCQIMMDKRPRCWFRIQTHPTQTA